MTASDRPGHNDGRGALRFLTELIAWIATPWALWPHSPPLAIAAVVFLIAIPAIFGTPGDRPGWDAPIAIPGVGTILLVLIQLVAASAASWALWPNWAAITVTTLCLIVISTERPRWRNLLTTPRR